MVESQWGGGVAHHVQKGSTFLFRLPARFIHRVAFHLVLLQWSLHAFNYVLLHVGESTIQTFPCVVLEVIVRHYCVTTLSHGYVFMS